jgi:hypothetical protein
VTASGVDGASVHWATWTCHRRSRVSTAPRWPLLLEFLIFCSVLTAPDGLSAEVIPAPDPVPVAAEKSGRATATSLQNPGAARNLRVPRVPRVPRAVELPQNMHTEPAT